MTLKKYVPAWLDDFVVYYGLLPQSLSANCHPDYDKHLMTLLDDSADIHTKFLALTELSSNALTNSRLPALRSSMHFIYALSLSAALTMG